MNLFTILFLIFPLISASAAEIHDLIRAKKYDEAQALIEKEVSLLDLQDDDRCSPLHLAARWAPPEFVEYLLKNGADVNTRSYNEYTPLHVCGSVANARLLLKFKADPSALDTWGDTPLQHLSRKNVPEICDELVRSGVELDVVSALQLGRLEDAKLIAIRTPAVLHTHLNTHSIFGNVTPLGLAVATENLEMVKLFISLGAPIEGDTFLVQPQANVSALRNAIMRENLEITSFLLSKGAKVRGAAGKGYVSLKDYIAEHSSPEMKELIKRYAPDINSF